MMNPAKTSPDAPAPPRWTQLWIRILRVLDASVIEVSDGHYVGAI
jgi:hypothetical protein